MNTLALAVLAAAVASPRLGDNLWMWGHDTGHYDGPVNYARHDYKIPWSAPITMADACVEMGIPNCCVIRPGMPPPEDDYLTQFSKLGGISWLLWKSTREYCLEKAVRIPNIKAFDLDDFFMEYPGVEERPDGTKVRVNKGVMSLREIDETRRELSEKAGHPVELRLVLYTKQLSPTIIPACEAVDTVLLWTWDGRDVKSMGTNVCRFRSLLPDKPILLGLYMWDFGGHKPIEREFMQSQLDLAAKLYGQGIIEGMIFHCTPLVNKHLEAVEMAREWIRRHKDDIHGSKPKEELQLVRRGAAQCRIVVSPDASKPERFGAKELSKYIEKATGAKVEVAESGAAAPDGGVVPVTVGVDATVDGLREDGFVIEATEKGLSITGANPRGALYGCYDFLKRCVGVRWLVPGEDGEYVPEIKNIILPYCRIVVNPYLKIRKNRVSEPEGWLWNARNGLQCEAHPRAFVDKSGRLSAQGELLESLGAMGTGPCGHVMSNLLLGGIEGKTPKERAERLFAEHPEWFPLIGGRRVLTWDAGTPNPCFSNDAMVEHMAVNLVRELSVPHAAEAYCTIGNNDTTAWCECEKCRALDVPGVRAKGARSDRYWYAVNKIARKVWEKLPTAKLGGWAYQDFWYPPTKVKVDPRLRVLVSYNNQCWKHTVSDPKCPVNAEWRSIFSAWKVTGHPLLVNRDEISANDAIGSTMAPSERVVCDDLLAYPDYGCAGFNFCVGSPFPPFQKWHAKREPWFGKNYRWYAMWRVNYLAAQVGFYGHDAGVSHLDAEAVRLYYGAGWGRSDGISYVRACMAKAFFGTDGCQGWGNGSQIGACLAKHPELEKEIDKGFETAVERVKETGDERALRHVEREREMFEMTWRAAARTYRENYRELDVYAKKGEIVVDGVLDEADWAAAKPLDGFKVAPWRRSEAKDKNGFAEVQTTARIVRSPDMLYFGVECLEPAMDSRIAERTLDAKNPWKGLGDHIELFYQYPDMAEKCYHMMINSEGAMFCGIQVTPANFDGNFTTKANVAVKRLSDRWVVEVAIPTSEIGMKCFDGASWRANVARQRHVKGERESSSAAGGNFNGTGNFVNLKFK